MAELEEAEEYVEVGTQQIAPECEFPVISIEASAVATGGPGVFLDRLATMMHHGNITEVIKDQEKMLLSMEISNEKLTSFNNVSEEAFRRLSGNFIQNTKLLSDMKKELDTVFRRIRSLKVKVQTVFPDSYAVAESKHRLVLEDEDEAAESNR